MKIEAAVERLERNLPIRRNQLALPEPLRRLHQRILRHYLEQGRAPRAGDPGLPPGWQDAVDTLAAQHVVVLDENGAIEGAYPFVDRPRGFRVVTRYGAVNAMCAFDALAVNGMFGIPVRIESQCRLSAQAIVIEQYGGQIQVLEPEVPVFAAIDWQAAAGASSCSATLCLEMAFIVGEAPAQGWCCAGNEREIFDLHQARAVIAQVFEPLMTPGDRAG